MTSERTKNSLLISYFDSLGVLPGVQAARSLKQARYAHLSLHAPTRDDIASQDGEQIRAAPFRRSALPSALGPLQQIWNWNRFRSFTSKTISTEHPAVIVTMMLHGLAALPRHLSPSTLLVACIYDIPALAYAGRLDRIIVKKGWARLREANVVWASDKLKAQFVQEYGHLLELPLVSHNCPSTDFLPSPSPGRDSWLRGELRKQGASLEEAGGCILLRAGAVGEYGGIEETLEAMRDLPADHIFLMMGRPNPVFRDLIVNLIKKYHLQHRAFLWERSTDLVWRKALQGAHVGHLIHVEPPENGYMRKLYELNSSLSNTRLYQYMAAGLPIVAYDDPRMVSLYNQVKCFQVARMSHLKNDIRQLVSTLGGDVPQRESLGAAGRRAHLEIFNWEWQFAPVLAKITALEKSAPLEPRGIH